MRTWDAKRASRNHNAAVRHLARSFEMMGLSNHLAFNHAAKVLADASFHVERTLQELKIAGDE